MSVPPALVPSLSVHWSDIITLINDTESIYRFVLFLDPFNLLLPHSANDTPSTPTSSSAAGEAESYYQWWNGTETILYLFVSLHCLLHFDMKHITDIFILHCVCNYLFEFYFWEPKTSTNEDELLSKQSNSGQYPQPFRYSPFAVNPIFIQCSIIVAFANPFPPLTGGPHHAPMTVTPSIKPTFVQSRGKV